MEGEDSKARGRRREEAVDSKGREAEAALHSDSEEVGSRGRSAGEKPDAGEVACRMNNGHEEVRCTCYAIRGSRLYHRSGPEYN